MSNTTLEKLIRLENKNRGLLTELFLTKLYGFVKSGTTGYDLTDANSTKIEVKSSIPRKTDKNTYTLLQLLDKQYESVSETELKTCDYNCNIQNINTSKFDIMYYILYLADKVLIFSATAKQVEAFNLVQKHQDLKMFSISKNNIASHYCNLVKTCTYEELLQALTEVPNESVK